MYARVIGSVMAAIGLYYLIPFVAVFSRDGSVNELTWLIAGFLLIQIMEVVAGIGLLFQHRFARPMAIIVLTIDAVVRGISLLRIWFSPVETRPTDSEITATTISVSIWPAYVILGILICSLVVLVRGRLSDRQYNS